jgi:hypothetical protein
MPSRYEEAVYNLLSDEPVTPGEVPKKYMKSFFIAN